MDLSNLMGTNKPQTDDKSAEPVVPVASPPVAPPPPLDPVVPAVEPVVPPPPRPLPLEPVAPPPPLDPVVPAVEPVVPPPPPPVVPSVNPPVEPVVLPPMPTTPTPVTPPPPPATGGVPGEVFEGVGSGKYKVVVLKEKCIGAASCIAVSPKTFELNDQQIAKVLPTINTETDENLLLAAQSCPTLAIEVYDTATGEKVWPK